MRWEYWHGLCEGTLEAEDLRRAQCGEWRKATRTVISCCIKPTIDINQYIPRFVFKSFTNLYQNGKNELYCLQFVVLSHCIKPLTDFSQYIPRFVFKPFANLSWNCKNELYYLQIVVLSHCIKPLIDFNQYIPRFVSDHSLICTEMAEINHIVWDLF